MTVATPKANDLRPFQKAVATQDWLALRELISACELDDWGGWTLLGLAVLLGMVAQPSVAEEIAPSGAERVRRATVAAAQNEGRL